MRYTPNPDHIAWHVGDTFINFRDMSPADQWKRIVEMIQQAEEACDDGCRYLEATA